MILRLLLGIALLNAAATFAGEARIIKVLPHLLDQRGRNSIHPSLFDRDAYQQHLRANPDLVSALQFDVQYKTQGINGPLHLRVEVRGSNTPLGERHIFETEVKTGRWFSKWGKIKLSRAMSDEVGSIVAWRATLLQDGEVVAQHQSFLW